MLTLTVICWGSQFGFLGVTLSSQWQIAMALFMVGYITYGVTLVFYASVFPRLARNTARTKEARDQFSRGEIALEDYERVEMLEKNRISNISTAHSNCESSVHGIPPGFHPRVTWQIWSGADGMMARHEGPSRHTAARPRTCAWLKQR